MHRLSVEVDKARLRPRGVRRQFSKQATGSCGVSILTPQVRKEAQQQEGLPRWPHQSAKQGPVQTSCSLVLFLAGTPHSSGPLRRSGAPTLTRRWELPCPFSPTLASDEMGAELSNS